MANPFKLETPDQQFTRRSFVDDAKALASTPMPFFDQPKTSPLGFMGAYDRKSGARITENEPTSNSAVAPTVAYGAVAPRLGREGASAVRAIDNAQAGGGLRAAPVAAPVGVNTPTVGRIKPIQEEHYSHNNGVVSPVFRGQDTDRVAAHITYAPTDRGTFKKTIRMDGRVGADNALINGEFNRDKMVPGGYNPRAVAAQQGGVAAGQGTAMDQYMAMAQKYIPDAQQVSGLVSGSGRDFSRLVNAANARKINQQRLGMAMEMAKIDATKAGTVFDMQQKQAESQRKDREEQSKKYDTFFTDKEGKLNAEEKARFMTFVDTIHPAVKANQQVTPEKLVAAFRSMPNTQAAFDWMINRDVNRGLDFNKNLVRKGEDGRVYEIGSDKSAGRGFVNGGGGVFSGTPQDPYNLDAHAWLSGLQVAAMQADEAAKNGKAK